MNIFEKGDIVKHMVGEREYEVTGIINGFITVKDFEGQWNSTYFKLIRKSTINMRNESICIKVGNKEIAQIIWDFLLSKGYKENTHSSPTHNYIWVNFNNNTHNWKGEICYASNNSFVFDKNFNASTELGVILDFFNKKPSPPEFKHVGHFTIYKDGVVKYCGAGSENGKDFDDMVNERNKFLATWDVYNNQNK